MPLKKPHEYVIDKSTKEMRITAEHPQLRFGVAAELLVGYGTAGERLYKVNPDFHPPIIFQEGAYYYENGEQLPVAKVPQYIRDAIAAKGKPVAGGATPRRTLTMEEIEDAGRSDEAARRLLDPASAAPKAARKKKKSHHKKRPAPAQAKPITGDAAAATG